MLNTLKQKVRYLENVSHPLSNSFRRLKTQPHLVAINQFVSPVVYINQNESFCIKIEVIRTVVDDVQTAYVEGRNILDGPFIINEKCYWAKKVRKRCSSSKSTLRKPSTLSTVFF